MIDVSDLLLLGWGHCCKCYAVSERLVLKCYKDEWKRNEAFGLQRKGWLHGVGPEPWGKRTVTGTEWCFAYWSRRAQPCAMVPWAEIDALGERMRPLGLSGYDLCHANAGLINGRLVCVDFDPVSMGTRR